MSEKGDDWTRKANRVELNFAIGDLAIAAELMRKGSVSGMAQASGLLRRVWPVIKDGATFAEDREDWKAVVKMFFELSLNYPKRAQEVGQKVIIKSGNSGKTG